jgi:hypothetical protein
MQKTPLSPAMYHGCELFRKGERIVKRLMRALAAIALFLTTAALPSLADGNPTPPGSSICKILGCSQSL